MCMTSPAQTLASTQLSFIVYFCFVSNAFLIERSSPKKFSSINTCGRHATRNSSHYPKNASRFLSPLLMRR
jgi:hypothetical protein